MNIRIRNGGRRLLKVLGIFLFLFNVSAHFAKAQSTSQSFPTAITNNEITGTIPARDVGDSRLTGYFYTFNGLQGDVFINVVTSNLNGDIDVFTADNLRPLTKITLYADNTNGETGRVVYLRQPTKLILRVEGRTPNDNAATFRIKFAGSFAPAEVVAENADSEIPTVKTDNQTDVRVNSVGTIIEVKPKPTPQPKESIARIKTAKETDPEEKKTGEIKVEAPVTKEQTAVTENDSASESREESEAKTVAADEIPKNKTLKIENPNPVVDTETAKETTESIAPVKKKPVPRRKNSKSETVAATPPKIEKSRAVKAVPPSALENIRLIVLFKDGTKIERPMSDVLKVGVDKGILTVISKDGQIGRYSILDVEKMTIE